MIKKPRFMSPFFLMLLLLSVQLPANASSVRTLSDQNLADLLGWQKDANAPDSCHGHYVDHPPKNQQEKQSLSGDMDPLGLTLSADNTEVLDNDTHAILDGHVNVNHGKYFINAEHADIFRDPQSKHMKRLSLSQYVRFWLPGMSVFADKASVDLTNLNAELEGVLFRLGASSDSVSLPGRGSAKSVKKQGDSLVVMHDATYTTCPPTRQAWHLRGSTIKLNQKSGWGSVTHARLYVKKWPVFYFPYFMFPLDDRRHTGFLLPSIAYSNKHHSDVRLPLYINIAPNYDATFTPRFIQDRGWEANLLSRFLTAHHEGQLDLGILSNDRMFSRFKSDTAVNYVDNDANRPYLHQLNRADTKRSRIVFKDDAHWGRFWTAHAEFNHVSDPYYYRDLGLGSEATTQDQLLNQLEFNYHQGDWQGVMRLQETQTLHQINQYPSTEQYRQLPYLSLTRHVPYFYGTQLELDSEWVYFDRKADFATKSPVVKGKRGHLSSMITLPIQSAHAYVKPTWLMQGTWYDLHDQAVGNPETPHRGFNTFWVDSGMRLDRPLSVHNHPFIQTLEPRLYYLYTPYKQQDTVPLFDTIWQVTGYDQLFSWQRFIGHDRVSDENRVALGLQTRLLDAESGAERVKLALGGGYAFNKRETCMAVGCSDDDTVNDRFSPVSGVLSYAIDDHRKFDSSLVWLPGRRQIDHSELGFHFSRDNERRFDLSYNHFRPSVANGEGRHTINAGLIWPVSPKWQALLGWNYDITVKHAEKSLIGLKYESCCWAVRVLAGRQLVEESSEQSRHYDHIVYLQFLLKGLGSVGSSSGTAFIQSFNPDYQDKLGKSVLSSSH